VDGVTLGLSRHLLVMVLRDWLEQDHGDGPVGVRLIDAVSRVRRDDPRPPGFSLSSVLAVRARTAQILDRT
jgi:hypothetical protein